MRFMSTPADVALGGRAITAGSVMEWIDKAAYACAAGWAGTYCVTAYVGNVHHARRIDPGDLVEVRARICHTGRTSMHVAVLVSSCDPARREFVPATTCVLVFVAKGLDGRPTPVQPWAPVSEADRLLAHNVDVRTPIRDEIRELIAAEPFPAEGYAPRTTMRFMVPPGVVNWGGAAHGGTVMRWMDETAYACAAAWAQDSRGRTPDGVGSALAVMSGSGGDASSAAIGVYSGEINFLAPVRIGDLVQLDARLLRTTTHGMHILVRVLQADPRTPHELTLTGQSMSVFVVPGSPAPESVAPVKQWQPLHPTDVRLDAVARKVLDLRKEITPIPADLVLAP